MPHLARQPEKVNALANMPRGEGVPYLVGVAISHPRLFQCRHPRLFTYSISVCPRAASFWITENKITFQAGKRLLIFQRQQRLAIQLHFPGAGLCLGPFYHTYDTGGLYVRGAVDEINIRPAQRAQFGGAQSGIGVIGRAFYTGAPWRQTAGDPILCPTFNVCG